MYKSDNSVKIICAFSLVEMLMALLVASLLMVAMAPVMTKKFQESISISGLGGAFLPKVSCAYVNDGSALVIKDTEANACNVPESTYLASMIIASGGGGGGGASLKSKGTPGATLADTNVPSTYGHVTFFDRTTSNLTIEMAAGGAGGGGGAYYYISHPESQADCTSYGLGKTDTDGHTGTATSPIFIYDPWNHLCVNAYNQINSTDCLTYTNGSVVKKVCGPQPKAIQICANFFSSYSGKGWRLPTADEESKWTTDFVKKTPEEGGLGGCSSGGTEFPSCPPTVVGDKHPAPYHFISSTLVSNSICQNNDGVVAYAVWNDKYAYSTMCKSPDARTDTLYGKTHMPSVRCVSEIEFFRPKRGGGGSAGSYLKHTISDDVLEKIFELGDGRGKVVTFPGSAGTGGAKGTTSGGNAGNGNNGSPTKIAIYASPESGTETLIWLVEIPGGYGGSSAIGGNETASFPGSDGKPKYDTGSYPTPKCKYYNILNSSYNTNTAGHDVNCSVISGFLAGQEAVTTTGGVTSTLDGAGSGGNGNTCVDSATAGGTPTCSAGTNGTNGRVKVTHTLTYPGAGGGGGGAGVFAVVNNVAVRPNDLIKVQVGNGGAGGSVGSDGIGGGNTIVEITRNGSTVNKFTLVGGGGGKGAEIGKPNELKAAVAGKGGLGGKITTDTHILSGAYFPADSSDGNGGDGALSEDYLTAAGGNGGFNPKISPLAASSGTLNGKACGGYSTTNIKVDDTTEWECTVSTFEPLPLLRSLKDGEFSSDIIKNYAPGSTGGGGGAYDYNETTSASGGAKGMGGYVYIWFGDWSETPMGP